VAIFIWGFVHLPRQTRVDLMLRNYRRHGTYCHYRSERDRRCKCRIYIDGTLGGESTLTRGIPIEDVSVLLRHKSVRITEAFIRSGLRRDAIVWRNACGNCGSA